MSCAYRQVRLRGTQQVRLLVEHLHMRTRDRLRHIKFDNPIEKHWLDRVLEIVAKKGTEDFLEIVRAYRIEFIRKSENIKQNNPFESTKHYYEEDQP